VTTQSDREVSAAVPAIRYAWAKVNLYLHVTGRRSDGYHEIDSLIVFAGVGDRLSFEPAETLSLHVDGPFAAAVPDDAGNLVLRAGRALAAACAPDLGARIGLQKNLPVAAGLGGGSADAAAAIAGLVALGGLTPQAGVLEEIALGLGADVPACLFGRPVFAGGIGERLERAPPVPPGWLVIVNPGVPLATSRVFEARTGNFASAERWTSAHTDIHALADHLAGLQNDLDEPARHLAPEIDSVLDRLARTAGVLLSRLSGSGATCFGLFEGPDEARAAAAEIAADQPHWWVAAAPMLHGPLNRPWSA
jgi:4-diphosphocytidyl-2-C-methyl-D-erythritol kinase